MAKAKFDPNNFWQVFRYTQIALWSFVIFIILFFVGVNYGLLGAMPDIDSIQNPRNDVSTTVYSNDGEVLGSYFTENRIEVPYDELSPYLVKGLVATEDKRFYQHSGIDLKSLFRAVVLTGLLGQDEGGGSTITQQLAKNLFHDDFHRAGRFRRMSQKLSEWVLAAKLERTFTKEELISVYLNTVAFGYNSYGIKTAAFTYFYKTPAQLKPEEAATLVGMLNAPSRFNPVRHPEETKERRNTVLRRMAESGTISASESETLQKKAVKIDFHNPDFREGIGTYFREYVRQELKFWCEKNPKPDGSSWDVYQDGLKVYTTVDSRMQRYAEEAVAAHLPKLQQQFFKEWKGKDPWKFGERAKPDLLDKMMKQSDRYKQMKADGKSDAEIKKAFDEKVEMTIFSYDGEVKNGIRSYSKDTTMSPLDSLRYYMQVIQVGFLAVDAKTGDVLAWVGGPNIRYFQLDHVKKTTKRQVGSTMKPIMYATAIEMGYQPCTLIPYTAPECGGASNSGWNPAGSKNWKEGDMVPMQEGLWASDNKITAKVMCEYIRDPSLLVDLAKRMNIESPLEAVPALSLGVCDVSLIEMVGAYTCFANLGTYSKPHFIKKITDKNGNVLAQFGETHKESMSEKTAYITTHMMKGVIDSKVGTSGRIRRNYGLQMPLAGKTGTTDSNSDAWFIGFNPNIVAGCWVGFEQPSIHFLSTNTGQGASAALPVVGEFLRKSFNDRSLQLGRGDFPLPSDSTLSVGFDCQALPDDSLSNISITPAP
jgi:penicillin-binding protein 1A